MPLASSSSAGASLGEGVGDVGEGDPSHVRITGEKEQSECLFHFLSRALNVAIRQVGLFEHLVYLVSFVYLAGRFGLLGLFCLCGLAYVVLTVYVFTCVEWKALTF